MFAGMDLDSEGRSTPFFTTTDPRRGSDDARVIIEHASGPGPMPREPDAAAPSDSIVERRYAVNRVMSEWIGERLTADNVSPTARELRAARENMKLTRDALSGRVGYTSDYIEKVENGRLPVTEAYVDSVAPTLAEGVDAASLLRRMRLDERKEGTPGWFRPWQGHEQAATEIRNFEPLLIPGLLQTEAYAQALLGDDDQVASRVERQAVLSHARVVLIVAERVLHEQIGPPPVMIDQLIALTETSATVHVLPANTGTYLGTAGSFALATVDSVEHAYADTALRGITESEPDILLTVRQRWEMLASEALPTTLSRTTIMKAAERWKTES